MKTFLEFKEKLKDPESAEHKALLTHAKGLVAISRKEMASHYSEWDAHDATFRSCRKVDKEDRAAATKDQPKKMVVPLTFAQIMAFVTFNCTTLMQNRRFFELEPTGSEDNPLREPMELIVERDLRKNQWQAFLVQFFLDIGRFSIGAAEVCWKDEYRWMRVPQTVESVGAFGVPEKTTTADFQQIPVFQGNKVYPVSPYRFLPDTRLPLTRYQEGEFCGSEDMFSMSGLQGDESLFNLDKIPKFDTDEMKARKGTSRIDEVQTRSPGPMGGETNGNSDGFVKDGPVVITKLVLDITPANFQVAEAKGALGEEKHPVRYLLWFANDKTIIRFEEAYWLHGQFPYICAQFIPDQHQTINESLADVCEQITSLITWKLNTHIASQRNSVQSKWVIDPAGIDQRSLESTTPYIYLKKNASQQGVDRFIKQFVTTDVTQGVMDDTAKLKELLEVVTGFAGNMQGQYSSGRRSAREAGVVAQAGSARGRTTLGSIWDTAFEPLGKQLIANNRQEMEQEAFDRIVGRGPHALNTETGMPYSNEELFALFKADPVTIATSEDFFVFDGTIPSEKAYLAESLQEVFMAFLQNPQIAMILGYGPPQIKELFSQIYSLRGVTPARLPAPIVQQPGVIPMPAQQIAGGESASASPA